MLLDNNANKHTHTLTHTLKKIYTTNTLKKKQQNI